MVLTRQISFFRKDKDQDQGFLANVRYMLYRPSVCRLSFVRPTQAVQIFGNISMALGILAIQ